MDKVKLKLAIMLGAFLCLIGGVVASLNLHEEVEASTINTKQEVWFGTGKFTSVNTVGNKLYLLSKDAQGADEETWGSANTNANTYSNTLGAISSLKSISRLPLSTDLQPMLNAAGTDYDVPAFSGNWWLGDASVNNRSKFVTGANSLQGTHSFNVTDMDASNSCTISSTSEIGEMPTSDYTQDDVIKQMLLDGRWNITALSGKLPGIFYFGSYPAAGDPPNTTCSGGNSYTYAVYDYGPLDIENGKVFTSYSNTNIPLSVLFAYGTDPAYTWIPSAIGDEFEFTIPDSDKCFALSEPIYVGGSGYAIQSYYFPEGYGNIPGNTATITAYSKLGEFESKTCPGQEISAGTALIRPLIEIDINDIIFTNTSKRSFTPSNTLSTNVPSDENTSGNITYLTMKDDNLKVALTSGATGVNGTNLSLSKPSNHIVQIPVTISGTSEGNRFVSVSATDTSGNAVFGVLDQMNADSGLVSLDVSNLLAAGSNTIQLTLYQENDGGSGHTIYRSEGVPITITFTTPQTIAFDSGNPTTAMYGTPITLSASVTSQNPANTDIVFSVKSGNATIGTSTYNPTTNNWTATLTPTSGTGSVVIAINKAGDVNADAAAEVTYTINLDKKPIVLVPNITATSGSYMVGDSMPTLASVPKVSGALLSGDSIPSNLKPDFINTDGSSTQPSYSGTIDVAGSWKLIYPSTILNGLTGDFADKYDVVKLEDWNDDNQYTFTTMISTIPSGWVEVTPDANANGWNKSQVTVKPSTAAISAGYTTVGLVDASGNVIQSGSSILYSVETSPAGETPDVVLIKATIPSTKTTIRTIKIDLTNPTASASVVNANTWSDQPKTVTITSNDNLSGIQKVEVVYNGTSIPVTNGVFQVSKNGTYTITVTDNADNAYTFQETIQKVDVEGPTVNASLGSIGNGGTTQDINVTYTVGDSGVQSYIVYYKKSPTDTYAKLEDLDPSKASQIYEAKLSGMYKFELVNGMGTTVSDEVTVTGVTPASPITQITAYEDTATKKPYTTASWTKEDVVLELSNANSATVGTVTYEVSNDGGVTWTPLSTSIYQVSTTTWTKEALKFRASASGVVESTPKSFDVNIDKTKPATPTAQNGNQYISSNWFKSNETVVGQSTQKPSGIPITLYYKTDSDTDYIKANQYTFAGAGTHSITFKVIDEAGNESNISDVYEVNIDMNPPTNLKIEVKPVNTSSAAKLCNLLTFGTWCQEAQQVTLSAQDDYTPTNMIQYEYMEEVKGVKGAWQAYSGPINYTDTNIVLHVRAIDLAGNVSVEISSDISIDSVPPIIQGAENQTVYKQYYLPRFVKVYDTMSGLKSATYKHNGGADQDLSNPVKLSAVGSYAISAEDVAGNTINIVFQIVPLPDISTEIDGSEGSKTIIDQIQKEYDENEANFDDTEKENYEKWLEDAKEKWENMRKDVVETDDKSSKVEGQDDVTFDPNTELIVEEISKNDVPVLPKEAIKIYDVYLKKGDKEVLPNGDIKVYLPYSDKVPPIVYEINDDGTVIELKAQQEGDYVTFITNTLKKYAISNEKQKENKPDICVVGPDHKADSSDDVCGAPNGDGVPPVKEEDGSVTVPEGGKVVFPDKEIEAPDGATINPDGSVDFPDGTHFDPDGNETTKPDPKPNPDEGKNNQVCVVGPDHKADSSDDVCGAPNEDGVPPVKEEDGSVTVPEGGKVIFPDKEIEAPDGATINPDGSVDFPDGTHFDPNGNETTKPDPKPNPDDGKNDQVCVVGPDGKIGTDDDVCGKPNEDGDKPIVKPDGSITVPEGGSVIFPDGSEVELPDGGIIKPDGSVELPDGTIYDKDGNKKDPDKKKECKIKDSTLNKDTDGNGIPDINLDLDGDCYPDLNIDVDGDGIPDVNIDTNGDGKPNINIDINNDGTPDLNMTKITSWKPNLKANVNGFAYETMTDITSDKNIDTDGDGYPDENVDDDWYTSRGIEKPNSVKGTYNNENTGGVSTGDQTKWTLWWILMTTTIGMMSYSYYRKHKA